MNIPPTGIHTPSDKLPEISITPTQWNKISKIVKDALFVLGSVFCAVYQSPLFFTGMFMGLVFPETGEDLLNRVKHVWNKQKTGALAFGIGVSILAFPLVIMGTTFLVGNQAGLHFKESKKVFGLFSL